MLKIIHSQDEISREALEEIVKKQLYKDPNIMVDIYINAVLDYITELDFAEDYHMTDMYLKLHAISYNWCLLNQESDRQN